MAKKNKKQNFKDTSAESLGGIDNVSIVSCNDNQELDPAQIDIEDQIAEEEKAIEDDLKLNRPQFKDPDKRVKIAGNVSFIDNSNITERTMYYLIDNNICSPDDFEY